jgi:hypothetical protein
MVPARTDVHPDSVTALSRTETGRHGAPFLFGRMDGQLSMKHQRGASVANTALKVALGRIARLTFSRLGW